MSAVRELSTVDHYEREGFAIFRDVLDRDLIAEAATHVEWLERNNPGLRPEHLGHELMREDPFWVRLISDDRLLDIAEMFLGSNIALFASHYISKPPFTGQPVLWHQDGSYWPLDPMEVVTLWLAVDESTPANGCMRVIPGTHREKLHGVRPRRDIDNVLATEIDVPPDQVDEGKAVDLVLAPGDVSTHHPNIIHGSNPNNSPHRRCGLTIRYIPTTTRITASAPWPSCFLLRGDAVPGVNEYQPRPRYEEGRHMPFAGAESWS